MTRQQQVIYESVKDNPVHPTADEVWSMARRTMPHIGIATVYRALDKLSKEGLLRRISSAEEADRFDGTLTPHYHALCRSCGRMRDVDLGDIDKMILERAGGTDTTVEIILRETCSDCTKG